MALQQNFLVVRLAILPHEIIFPVTVRPRYSWQDNLTSATHSCLQEYLPLVNGSRSPSFSVCLQRIGFALGIPLIIANLSSLVLQVRLHIHVNNM